MRDAPPGRNRAGGRQGGPEAAHANVIQPGAWLAGRLAPLLHQHPGAPAGAASFEDAFQEELVQEFGDLGPAVTETSDRPSGGGGGRGGRRRR